MKKTRTKPTPIGPPTWFPTLESLPPYHTVRVPAEHTEEWLAAIIQQWESPGTRHAMQKVWRSLFESQQQYARSLAACDWGQESSHQLVWWAIAHGSLRRGLDTFLSPPYNELPLPVRQWLYVHALLPLDEQAFLPIKRVLAIWQALPFVRTEIDKRTKQHVGSPAGTLLFVYDLMRLTEADPMALDRDVTAVADDAIKKLRSRTWSQAAARIGEALPHMPAPEKTTALDAHLSGAIWETITKKWGHLQGLDAIARSLDGGCNIAPRAVTDRMMKPDRLRELFPFLEEGANHQLPGDDGVVELKRKDDKRTYKARRITLSITEEDSTHTAALSKQGEDIIQRFIKLYPKHKEGIEFCLSEEPLKKLATARGIAVQTIINRKNRAREALKQFAGES